MEGQYRDLIRRKIVDAQAARIPAFTPRDVRLPAVPGKAIAVIGMRRAGKTTFLWELLSRRADLGTERAGLLYFNFEDERLAGLDATGLGMLVDEYYRLHPEWRDNARLRPTFFLDEIQVVRGWERFARRLLDTERIELFISGSSARLLSREVATSMRGRAMEARVYPFSLREALRHAEHEPAGRPIRWPKAVRSAVEAAFARYLIEGGFPEAQGIQRRDRVSLLRGYVDLVLLRDVIERHGVSHPVALRWLSRQLLGNAAGAFSVSKFTHDLKGQGIPVAKDTLHAYLAHLEDAFLIHSVPVAGGSERRRMVNPRKAYPADPGMIPVFDRGGRANSGHALETCVLLELVRRECEVGYVKTRDGLEVDFLARDPEGSESLIQVCADAEATETREREFRALLAAAREHPKASLHLITLYPEALRETPAGVEVHSAAEWLLG